MNILRTAAPLRALASLFLLCLAAFAQSTGGIQGTVTDATGAVLPSASINVTNQATGENSAWIDRARTAKQDIELALNEQKEALAKLPYSEKELQKALDDLAAKTQP